MDIEGSNATAYQVWSSQTIRPDSVIGVCDFAVGPILIFLFEPSMPHGIRDKWGPGANCSANGEAADGGGAGDYCYIWLLFSKDTCPELNRGADLSTSRGLRYWAIILLNFTLIKDLVPRSRSTTALTPKDSRKAQGRLAKAHLQRQISFNNYWKRITSWVNGLRHGPGEVNIRSMPPVVK